MNLLDNSNFVGYVGLSKYGNAAAFVSPHFLGIVERMSVTVGKGPRMRVPKRLNWWTLTLLACLTVQGASAQEAAKEAPKSEPASKKDAAPAEKAAPSEKAAPTEAEKTEAAPATAKVDDPRFELTEAYRDPRVDDLLDISLVKEAIPPRPNFSNNEEKQLQNMAGGRGDLYPRTINRFVEAKAAELTNKKAIEAMLSGEGSVNSQVRILEQATLALIAASRASNAAANSPFMSAYAAAMIKTFQPLLEGHLITRSQVALAMASTGSLDIVPSMIKILGDEKQPWQMKAIALNGINNAIQEGRRIVAFTQRTQWTISIINMLRNEEDAPWFLKAQAAAVIGNLRIVSESVPERKVHPAEVLMDFLTDDQARPEVRLEAGRGLGLLDVTSQFRPFNHLLEVTALAEAIADIAERASTIPPSDSSRSQQLIALLAEKSIPAFLGIEGMVNSGFLPQMAIASSDTKSQDSAKAIFEKIKGVINAGSAYIRARGALVPERRTDLQTQIIELRKLIGENEPKSRTLIPGGKEFPVPESASAEVAQGSR